jgi:D-3-phosphoglycerate dehydrogenase / 2-oxoglutarate reductase
MTDTVDNLILDLLEWLGDSPRPYPEVLDAWRTSCPRLPVWEEANDRGYIERDHSSATGPSVSVSVTGVVHLRMNRASGLRPIPTGRSEATLT